MPRLWNDTIEEHREAVREAALDAAGTLVAAHGVAGVTMSRIADATGIGRATLYRYFPDVEAILFAWHDRHVAQHLRHLAEVRDAASAGTRLQVVLETYATIIQHQQTGDLSALLHRGEHVQRAQRHLITLVRDLVAEAAEAGAARTDVAAEELAAYCLAAVGAARALRSKAALRRLVEVVLDGLRP
jgi:AcrR family transcriptional regulator